MNPEYSLEGLMLKLQSYGHLMQTADSLEKTLMLGKIEGKRRMGGAEDEMVRYITNSMNRNLSKLWEIVEDRGSWHGVAKSGKWLGGWTSEQWEIAHFIIVMPPVHVHVMELSGGLPSEWIQLLSHVWQILSDVRCRCIWIFLTACYCFGVMIWTSGYTISVLHRHKQQVQHIHSNSISPDLPTMPEPHTPSWSWWPSSTLTLPFLLFLLLWL